MKNRNDLKIEDFCTEEVLLKSLSIEKKTLDVLRSKRKFPFINVNKTKRLYYLPDVCKWLLTNRRVLNLAGGE